MNVLLTGASGFVGRALAGRLASTPGVALSVAVRKQAGISDQRTYAVGDINRTTDWGPALAGQNVVIHAAARAHVTDGSDPAEAYYGVNVEGTEILALKAAEAGVNRFIFISSIGVNGNQSSRPFSDVDAPNPSEPYAVSKLHAEQRLLQVQRETGMEVVIIRPPLVYGPAAPGNFGKLVGWVQRGVPLPFGAIHNKRSLVGIDNLVDLIIRCIDHPAAANQTFLASDGVDLSTTELLRSVANAMGKPLRLVPVPAGLLQAGAGLLGKKAMAQRLLGSLQVDISKTREVLGWEPPYTVEEGLRRCFL